MALKSKLDSNDTSLAYAEESSIGVISAPTWYRLNPNSYNDFGGEITIVAPTPITNTRQRDKGVTTDLDASGGFNHNLSNTNLRDLMQGFMFADERTTTQVALTGAASGVYTLADTSALAVGDWVRITGFANAENNVGGRISALTLNTDITLSGVTPLDETIASTATLAGVRATAGDLDIDASGTLPVMTSTTVDFTALDIEAGSWVYIGGDAAGSVFANAENNGFKRVKSVDSATQITFDKSDSAMVTEASTTETIDLFYGSMLKNESTPANIVRRTYHLERILGAPDDASSDVQSEVIEGATPSEMVINIPQAALANVDMNFIGVDNSQYAAGNELQSSVQEFESTDIINTSSDFSRLKMAIYVAGSEAPSDLFAYITEATITINNNLSPNKAVATLGAFDITAGTFSVTAQVTAYFVETAAVAAVRNNSDVTFDFIMAKDNRGVVLDLPLVALGDGRLSVELDAPITLPLSMDAATASKLDSTNLDFTAAFTFFDYLPDVASA